MLARHNCSKDIMISRAMHLHSSHLITKKRKQWFWHQLNAFFGLPH